MVRILKILFLFLLLSNSVLAVGYHAKNGGDDNLDGLSDATAFATINKLNNTVGEGDAGYLKRGSEWNERLIANANNCSFLAYGEGADPIVNGIYTSLKTNVYYWNIYSKSGDDYIPVQTIGSNYIYFFFVTADGQNAGNKSIGFQFIWDISTQTPYHHIYMTECDVFDNGNIAATQYGGGIKFNKYGYSCYVVGGTVHDNIETNVQTYSDNDLFWIDDIHFSDVEIYNTLPFDDDYETGLNFGWRSKNCTATRMNIYDCRVLVQFDSLSEDNQIQNSFLKNGKQAMIRWLANSYGDCLRNKAYNMTLVSDNGELYGLVFGTYSDKSNTGHEVKNSIVCSNTAGFKLIDDYVGAGESSYSLDYNLYYGENSPVFDIKTDLYTLSQFSTYQSETNQDANSLAEDPKFNFVYSLTEDSPCVNTGLSIEGINEDFHGNDRDELIDRGAFEYIRKTYVNNATLKNCTLN